MAISRKYARKWYTGRERERERERRERERERERDVLWHIKRYTIGGSCPGRVTGVKCHHGRTEGAATNKNLSRVCWRVDSAADSVRGFDWIGRSIAYCIRRIPKAPLRSIKSTTGAADGISNPRGKGGGQNGGKGAESPSAIKKELRPRNHLATQNEETNERRRVAEHFLHNATRVDNFGLSLHRCARARVSACTVVPIMSRVSPIIREW